MITLTSLNLNISTLRTLTRSWVVRVILSISLLALTLAYGEWSKPLFHNNDHPPISKYPNSRNMADGLNSDWPVFMQPDPGCNVVEAYSFETSDDPIAVLDFYRNEVPRARQGLDPRHWDLLKDNPDWLLFRFYRPAWRLGPTVNFDLKIASRSISKGHTNVQVLKCRFL
jgi:hypothetical protein